MFMPKTDQNCCYKTKKQEVQCMRFYMLCCIQIAHIFTEQYFLKSLACRPTLEPRNCTLIFKIKTYQKYERRSLVSSLPSFVEENVEPCTFKLQICLKILGYLLLISRDGIYFKIKKKIQYALTSCVYGGTLML